ncbi:MAG: chromate transporter [Clostridia bacterium]|nr:chromate transporter [Clostridia bacterium]
MTLVSLFFMFFKIGLFTFGGGYAMLPLISEEITRRGLLSAEELTNFVAVSESTPGPFAVNIATYVGLHTAGLAGSVCATLGVVLPSFIVILAVAHIYEKFRRSRVVAGIMSGLRPAVVGLLAAAAVGIAKTVFFQSGFVLSAALAASALIFALILYLSLKKVHPIKLIILSAGLGMAVMYTLSALGCA